MKTKGQLSKLANEAGISLITKEILPKSGNVVEKKDSYTKNAQGLEDKG
jgi:hypothetical protein